MANTHEIKRQIEPYVRGRLADGYSGEGEQQSERSDADTVIVE
jgi:hypothetical protein